MRKSHVVLGGMIAIIVGAMTLAPAVAADDAGGVGDLVTRVARMLFGGTESAAAPSVPADLPAPQLKAGSLDLDQLALTEANGTDCSSPTNGQQCNSFQCVGGENDGEFCRGTWGYPDGPDADCPGGYCRIPPGAQRSNPIP